MNRLRSALSASRKFKKAHLRAFFYLLYSIRMKMSLPQNQNDPFAIFFDTSGTGTNRPSTEEAPKADWDQFDEEGKLAVDIVEDKKNITVISAMAGADAEKIEVFVHDDVLTIRGFRSCPVEETAKTSSVHKENFWGKFSRTVVLPVDVKGELASAEYKNGILCVTIPKRETDRKIPIRIVEE